MESCYQEMPEPITATQHLKYWHKAKQFHLFNPRQFRTPSIEATRTAQEGCWSRRDGADPVAVALWQAIFLPRPSFQQGNFLVVEMDIMSLNKQMQNTLPQRSCQMPVSWFCISNSYAFLWLDRAQSKPYTEKQHKAGSEQSAEL